MGSSFIVPQAVAAFAVAQGIEPEQSRAASFVVQFTGIGQSQTGVIDLSDVMRFGAFTLQAIYIDTSATANAVSVQIPGTLQVVTAKGYTQGYYPVLAPNPETNAPLKLNVVCNTAVAVAVPISLINSPTVGSVWATQ